MRSSTYYTLKKIFKFSKMCFFFLIQTKTVAGNNMSVVFSYISLIYIIFNIFLTQNNMLIICSYNNNVLHKEQEDRSLPATQKITSHIKLQSFIILIMYKSFSSILLRFWKYLQNGG